MCSEGVIHLSGYVMPEDEFPGSIDDLSDSDADKEDEEVAFEEAKPQLCISPHCCLCLFLLDGCLHCTVTIAEHINPYCLSNAVHGIGRRLYVCLTVQNTCPPR